MLPINYLFKNHVGLIYMCIQDLALNNLQGLICHKTSNQLSPTRWTPLTPAVIFHHLVHLFEPLVPLRNIYVWHDVICIHLLKYFKCWWWSFPKSNKKFQVYSLLCAYRWITWKRCKQKHAKKKIQWSQKAKITIIYTQDTMLNDNNICLSLFHLWLTQQTLLFRQTSYISLVWLRAENIDGA